ncbi:hypothetical protein VE00_05252 [Pseudogymnoascus sp. WSF 3629]|nr:hypothetical protein VE00_05252 [Pseudogymnoascus sp. WSF 3629]
MALNAEAIPPSSNPAFTQFPSRRSVVHSTDGIVACTQPLAARCGLRILQQGGNAADAAVAVAAGLNMTEPCSTGIGGDMFCLYYDAATKKVSAMNGSGRAGAACSLSTIRNDLGLKEGQEGSIPLDSVHAVTVPGAAAGWVDTVESFGSGKLSLEQILAPAIELGEKGFPVSEIAAASWKRGESSLRGASPNFAELLKSDSSAPNGVRAPGPGELFHNPTLSATFRALATEGKAGFYSGRVGEALVKVLADRGGRLTAADLANHANLGTEHVSPIALTFNGQNAGQPYSSSDSHAVKLWEHPPNGQGIVALMALGILESLESSSTIPAFKPEDHNTTPYLHAIIESLRISFSDASWFVADPNAVRVPTAELLSPSYLATRAALFDPSRATPVPTRGSPALNSCDTVYFAVTDSEGNAASFINSNYTGFGSAIVPEGFGFSLQNRAANFSLDKEHPNVLAPGKRPYHTIIPALTTNAHDDSLHSVLGVMGGFMQPQGHVQVLLNMRAFGFNPQQALDAPRVCIGAGMPDEGEVLDVTVYVEEGVDQKVVEGLRGLGHKVQVVGGWERGLFGRGQVIRRGGGVDSAGSDLRGDGGAYPA